MREELQAAHEASLDQAAKLVAAIGAAEAARRKADGAQLALKAAEVEMERTRALALTLPLTLTLTLTRCSQAECRRCRRLGERRGGQRGGEARAREPRQ